MNEVTRREPRTIEAPKWLGRRFNDLWLDELALPERLLEAFSKETVRIEEFTEAGSLVIRAELPGIDPDKDVEITVHDGMLHIKGSRTDRKEESDKAFYRSEFRYGMFERTIPLTAGATEKDVKASYKDGVLEVRVPIENAAPEATRIPVDRVV